jgi:hypothetical protein
MTTYNYELSESNTKNEKITVQNPDTELYIHELMKKINCIDGECLVKYDDLGSGFCKIVISSYENVGQKFKWLDLDYETRTNFVGDRCIYQFCYITKCDTLSSNQISQNIHNLSGIYR